MVIIFVVEHYCQWVVVNRISFWQRHTAWSTSKIDGYDFHRTVFYYCYFRDRSIISVNGFNVVLGSHSQSSVEKGEQSVPVEKFTFNPEYNTKSLIGDVAVIKLYTSVKYSNTIAPICLSKPGDVIDSKSTCVVAGWGNLKGCNTNGHLLQGFN